MPRRRRRYKNIYLDPRSYFRLPNPRSRYRKALVNILAQAIDFEDFDTVNKSGRRIPFTYSDGRGRKASFTGRAQVIRRYAPKKADRVVDKIVRLARLYAQGRISRRAYERRVKEIVRRAGLDKRTINLVVRKVKAKD